MSWGPFWIAVVSALATIFAGGGGFWVWRRGRKDSAVIREEAWFARLEKRVADLESELKSEKKAREKDRLDSYRVLNAFRLRESAWLSVWHSMTMALLALGGTIEPLPPILANWPDDLQNLYSATNLAHDPDM